MKKAGKIHIEAGTVLTLVCQHWFLTSGKCIRIAQTLTLGETPCKVHRNSVPSSQYFSDYKISLK